MSYAVVHCLMCAVPKVAVFSHVQRVECKHLVCSNHTAVWCASYVANIQFVSVCILIMFSIYLSWEET